MEGRRGGYSNGCSMTANGWEGRGGVLYYLLLGWALHVTGGEFTGYLSS